MPKHIVRLLLLIAIFGVVAVGAKFYFTDKSFGVYGHYRANSVAEIAADTPIYQGSAQCKSCHSQRYSEWRAGVHKVVKCEVCHRAGAGHPRTAASRAIDLPGVTLHDVMAREALERYTRVATKLSIPTDTVKLCTLCHEKMPGRPAFQPQIVVSQHDPGGQQCITCHNPHSPRLAATVVPKLIGNTNAGKARAAACAGCHGAGGISANPAWPNLAGQKAPYLVAALKAYKAGTRTDVTMAGITKGLSDADIDNLAVYYSGLDCKAARAGAPKEAPAGNAGTGQAKAAICASCHGAGGVSHNPMWPNLAEQKAAYIVNALKSYKAGVRKDPMMSDVVKDLSATDTENLAAFYASSNCR